jgi:hypothetical protein
VSRVSASGLRAPRNRADYLVIGPREFLPAAEPLLERRRSQGLRSHAVAVEDIYEEFGYGEARPEAVKDFFEYAYHHWETPSVHYVVLLGGATYDGKDYPGTGVVNRVPSLTRKTSYLWTASDPACAAVDSGGAEDLRRKRGLPRAPGDLSPLRRPRARDSLVSQERRPVQHDQRGIGCRRAEGRVHQEALSVPGDLVLGGTPACSRLVNLKERTEGAEFEPDR